MNRRTFVLGGVAFLGASSAGAVAFTEATVARDVKIGVVDDSSAVIQLVPGHGATTNGDGELVIDASTSGLNPSASFTYGDHDNPGSDNTFAFTNNSGEQRSFNISLTGTSKVSFELYDSGGSESWIVDNNDDQDVTLWDGGTVYAVMDVDTDGVAGGSTINGELTIETPGN